MRRDITKLNYKMSNSVAYEIAMDAHREAQEAAAAPKKPVFHDTKHHPDMTSENWRHYDKWIITQMYNDGEDYVQDWKEHVTHDTTYTNCLMISQMKELDLFDNIYYKYIKDIINRDYDDIEVEIEALDCDRVCFCKTRFTFELNINVSGGCMPLMVDRKFVVEQEYNTSSCYALMMNDLQCEDSSSSDE